MAIVYSYPQALPTLDDMIIGTKVDGDNGLSDNQTVNYTVSSLISLISSSTGEQNLQQVTNVGAITNLEVTFQSNIKVSGSYSDSNNNTGTIGQVLSSTAGGTQWANASSYTLPLAADGTRGGVQIGYVENGKNYPVELSSEKMFVNVPWTDTGTITSLTTTGTSGVSTLVGGVLNVPNYTYTEVDTLQTVCARGSTTSTSITMTGSGAAGYLYVTGNAATTSPTHTQGLAFAYNNSGGSRENEVFWNTGTTTVSNNNASYLGFWNEFQNSDAGNARVSSLQLKLYGTGELGLTGATPTISNSYWRMPTSAAPNTGYYLAKAAASINLEWKEPSISVDNYSGVPASASATGTAGTIRFDANYIYVCTATDTWKRVAVSSWV